MFSTFFSWSVRKRDKQKASHNLLKCINLLEKTEFTTVCEHEITELHGSSVCSIPIDRWFMFSAFSFPADPLDVLRALGLSESMEGVSLEAGFCTSRRGTEEMDLAYKIKKIQLSIPTKQLFHGSV